MNRFYEKDISSLLVLIYRRMIHVPGLRAAAKEEPGRTQFNKLRFMLEMNEDQVQYMSPEKCACCGQLRIPVCAPDREVCLREWAEDLDQLLATPDLSPCISLIREELERLRDLLRRSAEALHAERVAFAELTGLPLEWDPAYHEPEGGYEDVCREIVMPERPVFFVPAAACVETNAPNWDRIYKKQLVRNLEALRQSMPPETPDASPQPAEHPVPETKGATKPGHGSTVRADGSNGRPSVVGTPPTKSSAPQHALHNEIRRSEEMDIPGKQRVSRFRPQPVFRRTVRRRNRKRNARGCFAVCLIGGRIKTNLPSRMMFSSGSPHPARLPPVNIFR